MYIISEKLIKIMKTKVVYMININTKFLNIISLMFGKVIVGKIYIIMFILKKIRDII